MRLLIKLFPFLFKELSLNQRIKIFCESIGKDISYGKNLTHERLDELKVKRFKLKSIKDIL